MVMGQHGQQFRFGTSFQAKPGLVAVGLADGLDDTTLLVYLDRVNAEVVPFIARLLDGLTKGVEQRIDPTLEDVGEAQQHGGGQPGLTQLFDGVREHDMRVRA